jgi:hypothetical protein
MKLKKLEELISPVSYGATSGEEIETTYECPCGKGTVKEYNEAVPGFRDHSVYCQCEECDLRYKFKFNGEYESK